MREVLKDVKIKIIYFENNINAISGSNIIKMANLKTCYKCKIEQQICNFGKLKSSKDGYRYDCKNCRKEYRENNKENIKQKQQEYYLNNKDTLIDKNKNYRIQNNEKINNQRKEYRNRPDIKQYIKQKNKEYLPIKKQKIYERRKTDINFQLSEVLRSKIHKMIKGKETSYKYLIGCDIDFFKKWIEFRFDDEMTWNNYGTSWHIDHIIPISIFNFNNQIDKQICFHWSNLQPLKCLENQQKSNKLQLYHYFNNLVNVVRFNSKYKDFLGYQILNESLKWLRDNELRYGKNASYKLETSNKIDNPQPSS